MNDDWKVSVSDGPQGRTVTLHSQNQSVEEIQRLNKMLDDAKFAQQTIEKALDPKLYCKTCGSEALFKEGTKADGKHWSGLFCNKDRNHVQWNYKKA